MSIINFELEEVAKTVFGLFLYGMKFLCQIVPVTVKPLEAFMKLMLFFVFQLYFFTVEFGICKEVRLKRCAKVSLFVTLPSLANHSVIKLKRNTYNVV